ncbi:MAG: hypothetical protein U5K71_09920 [Gracilimonas sp.]|nr:hypothetical protein [Gracilimonas sp.]
MADKNEFRTEPEFVNNPRANPRSKADKAEPRKLFLDDVPTLTF